MLISQAQYDDPPAWLITMAGKRFRQQVKTPSL
jgi:hypothetical protein